MGKPVALEASAEDRLTLGFISMTTWRPVPGSTANCTLDPPVATPTRRSTAKAASRIFWYSTSVRVWAGATVIESPVCTPMGSRFSMEQTTTQLSRPSRITSSSYSFQPAIDSSTRISPMGLAARPASAHRTSSSSVAAVAAPRPPRMKAGRMMIGRPTERATERASSTVRAEPDRGTSRPASVMARLNSSRFSATAMASASAPISSAEAAASAPDSHSSMARLSPVWPPRVASTASGRSRSMIRVRVGASRGST